MKQPHKHAFIIALTLISGGAIAQHAAHHADTSQTAPTGTASPSVAASSDLPWVDGEVRRVDARTGKVTLRHGDITNLGMPPMTMAFQATEAKALAPLKVGDRVRFTADHINGVYTVIRIEVMP